MLYILIDKLSFWASFENIAKRKKAAFKHRINQEIKNSEKRIQPKKDETENVTSKNTKKSLWNYCCRFFGYLHPNAIKRRRAQNLKHKI